jgi:hypothetical protein
MRDAKRMVVLGFDYHPVHLPISGDTDLDHLRQWKDFQKLVAKSAGRGK